MSLWVHETIKWRNFVETCDDFCVPVNEMTTCYLLLAIENLWWGIVHIVYWLLPSWFAALAQYVPMFKPVFSWARCLNYVSFVTIAGRLEWITEHSM